MAKKTHHDFARVQLRPGRMICKRRNITSTKFKSKRIVMAKEKVIRKLELTIMDYTRKIKGTTSDKDKCSHLNELDKLICRPSTSLNTYLTEIFDTVFNCISHPCDSVRNGALKVIISVLKSTKDVQLHRHSGLLCGHIYSMMKNPDQKTASFSLKLLESMLDWHPELICHNTNILLELLPTGRKYYTRKVITYEKDIFKYSRNSEVNLCGYINAFLKNILLLKNKDLAEKDDDDDDKIVLMDCHATKSVVLYAGSGLKPVANSYKAHVNPFEERKELIAIIDRLLKQIPLIYCEIIGRESNADDNVFGSEPISDLSILIQLLCNVAELAEKFAYANAAEEIAVFLKKTVFASHKKEFTLEVHSRMADTLLTQRLALSKAALIYMQMKFLSSDDGELMTTYLEDFFSKKTFTSRMKYECIPYFVKIVQLCEYKKVVPKVVLLLLEHLILLLKTRVTHPNKKILIKLLMDMSCLPEYKYFIESKPMVLWYEWLTGHLKDSSKLDEKIMKMICKIAKFRYPSFIKLLDFDVLKSLLTGRNEDFRKSTILLLHNMDIDKEFLKNVYAVISLDSFPKKSAITLIHMLNVRFNQYPVKKRPYVDYIEFLLNIAIDVSNFSNTSMIDVEANNYTKAVQLIQDGHPFCIVPSLHWEHHSQLFDVCSLYLSNLPVDPVSAMYMKAVKELLHSSTLIPIHCALAMLKLDTFERKKKNHCLLMRDLNFSCLMTTSVLTQASVEDEYYKWNICELMNSMSLTTDSAIEILKLLKQGNFGRAQPGSLVVYHILRMIKVFFKKRILDCQRRDVVLFTFHVLQDLAEVQCSDKTMKRQPLYHEMYNFCLKYISE